jgi:hypothetical protein
MKMILVASAHVLTLPTIFNPRLGLEGCKPWTLVDGVALSPKIGLATGYFLRSETRQIGKSGKA